MPEPGRSKRTAADLAVNGGEPLFDEPLHVGRPNLGDRAALHARIDELLDRARLTNDGPFVRELEDRTARLAGVEHAVAVTNATTGIEILVRALGLDGEVIVPSFTFVGTAHALSWMGLTPVFADVERERPVIDPAAIERTIGPRTVAILGVHLWGHACDTDAIEAVAAEHGLAIVYDAAHALGGRHRGRDLGSFGRAEVISLHATKFVNAFEGGIITTDDGDLARDLRRLRDFGFSGGGRTAFAGTNAKMHEASAAMGLTSLEAMDAIVAHNRGHARRYIDGLAGLDGVRWAGPDPAAGNAQYVPFLIDERRTGIRRDDLYATLRAENILARRYFWPGCHRLEPYVGRREHLRGPLPRTEALCEEALVLPTGTAVDEAAVTAIVELIRFIIGPGAGSAAGDDGR